MIHDLTLEERLVLAALVGGVPAYLAGALYVLGPALGWILAALFVVRALDRGNRPPRLTPVALAWSLSMIVLLLALIIAHLQFDLGLGKTIKSSIGWAKGWALLALFPLAGGLRIRPHVVARGCSLLSLQILALVPIAVLAALVGLPEVLYVSPLKVVGGPGPEFFAVRLYSIEPSGGLRFWPYVPWAPALGFVGNVLLWIVLRERNRALRLASLAACVVLVLACGSRAALGALLLTHGLVVVARHLRSPLLWLGAALAAPGAAVAEPWVTEALVALQDRVRSARIESSRVREALGRIAVDRWQDEAVWWGHGIVERGPHLVEFMPIGSHHTWYGLLFVKGAIGAAALAVAMFVSAADTMRRVHWSSTARSALGLLATLFVYTFSENLEILAYLIWPGLLWLGLASAEVRPVADVRTGAERGRR